MSEIAEEIKKALDAATPGPWEDYGTAKAKMIYAAEDDSRWIAQMWYKSEEPMPNAANNAHLIANAPNWLRILLEENERLNKFCKEWAGEEDKFQDFGGWDRIEKMKADIERLTKERDEEKRHGELGWEQSDKWLEENGRLRAELDQVKKERDAYRQEAINERELSESIVAEREELYIELDAKDKVLEWIRDAGTDYQSIHRAREVLNQFEKGDTKDA